jgi:LDH2 family malate/lactate/ureidoglycolate dehydrogenase
MTRETLAVPYRVARQVGYEILQNLGAPRDVAVQVIDSLLKNDQAGAGSHGLLRLLEYVEDASAGRLDVTSRPTVFRQSGVTCVINGNSGFGVLSASAVVNEIREMLGSSLICAISLVDSGHLGRLRDIGFAVAKNGNAVMGFVNFCGEGQRVAPWGGRDARLCTNPILVAIPGSPDPFVLDISTSTVSEGRIRERWLVGQDVPDTWLIDSNRDPVMDPGLLYSAPAGAFMTPMGGEQGHKGYGLSVAVEILSGVIAGAGYSGSGREQRGNGGFFVGFSPEIFGRSTGSFLEDLVRLRDHLGESGSDVHWPGSRHSQCSSETLSISTRAWEEIIKVADQGKQ